MKDDVPSPDWNSNPDEGVGLLLWAFISCAILVIGLLIVLAVY